MSSSSGLIRGAGGIAAADKTRDGGVPAFEKYLPRSPTRSRRRARREGARRTRWVDAAPPRHSRNRARLRRSCAPARWRNRGPAWEPHARVLLPSLFAGGLSAPLVEALEAMATALPATLPADSEEAHRRHQRGAQPGAPPGLGARLRAGGGLGGAGAYSQGAHLQSNHGVAGHGGGHGGGGSASADGNANGDASHGGGATPGGTLREGAAMMKRVVSGMFDGTAAFGSPAGACARVATTPPETPARGENGASNGSTDGYGSPPRTPRGANVAKSPGRRANASASTPERSPPTPRARHASSRRVHQARVRLALRTLGTFPFGHSTLLGFVRRSAVEYLDDDDAATRREAALTCCRLLDVRSDRAAGGGEEGSVHGGLGGGYNSPSSSMVSGSSWSAGTEAYIMSRLLAAAVSDLDTDVRRAVLASFCRPSPVTDSHLGQAGRFARSSSR